jgi:hypothetical protein
MFISCVIFPLPFLERQTKATDCENDMHSHRYPEYPPEISVVFINTLEQSAFHPVLKETGQRYPAAGTENDEPDNEIQNTRNKDNPGGFNCLEYLHRLPSFAGCAG